MNGRFLVLILLLGLAAVSLAAPRKTRGFNRKRVLIHGRPWFGLKPPPRQTGRIRAGVSGDMYISSRIDHFDNSNTKTYQQRYWYNDEWYKPGGPAFLMIGGESAESSGWVSEAGLEWTKLAVDNNAMVFLIEHRYYGASQPTGGDMSTANLKYLSSKQALADIADFIPAMNTKFNLNNPKWITFGGSYSGALAAWSRSVYPDLIYGAVGSSGPVQAVVDFTGYLEVVRDALTAYNPACANSLKAGMAAAVANMATPSGRMDLYNGFKLCQQLDPKNPDQITNFYSSIIGNYMVVVQYSGDNAGIFADELTIPQICQLQMDTTKTDLQRMYSVNNYLMGFYGESCVDIDFMEYINYMKQASDDRAWVYQTCTEFGYYQSTDSTSDFYGNVITSDWYVKQCPLIYGTTGFDNTTIYANIDKTNGYYHGQNQYNGTRIVLPNGSNDPWHVLGVLKAPNNMAYPVPIMGTSHCADMYTDSARDPASLTAARTQVRQYVNSWLQN